MFPPLDLDPQLGHLSPGSLKPAKMDEKCTKKANQAPMGLMEVMEAVFGESRSSVYSSVTWVSRATRDQGGFVYPMADKDQTCERYPTLFQCLNPQTVKVQWTTHTMPHPLRVTQKKIKLAPSKTGT